MDKIEFEKVIKDYAKELDIDLNKNQIDQFYEYMILLIEWNKSINLTGITDPKEIIIKHFIDSLTVVNKIKKDDTIIDVGTGAGFPGIPIKIVLPESKVCLLDSLNKRISFLNEAIKKLALKNIEVIHGRAEDIGHDKNHREKYNIAIARAVAPLNVLVEYLMPLTKEKTICMKGPIVDEELEQAKKAISILGGKVEVKEEFVIPKTDISRTIIEIKKEKNTPKAYPRKAGTPSKKPI